MAKAGEYPEEKSLSAIMVNVWDDYLEIGKEVLKQKDMSIIFVTTSNSIIMGKKICDVLLQIKANKEVNIGMINSKANVINKMLEEDWKRLENKNEKEEAKESK